MVLEGQGHITREPGKARSIRLVDHEECLIEDEMTEEVYQCIRNSVVAGRIPTQAEIADVCFISRTTVRRALSRLEGQGRIRLESGMRGIHLVQ